MIKKTFKEINKFNSVVKHLMEKNPELPDTKFGYAIKRFEELNLIPLYQKYQQELGEVRIDFALTDKETGALLRDPYPKSLRGFLYDKQGMKDVMKAEQKIDDTWNPKEFDIEPYICKKENLPKDLTDEEIEEFTGLVI